MSGFDLFLKAAAPDDAIEAAARSALRLGEGARVVVGSRAALESTAEPCDVFIAASKLEHGDFCFRYELVHRDATRPGADDVSLAIAMARALGIEAITSDREVNPYSWLLIRPDGRVFTVQVDAHLLDNERAFRVSDIVREEPPEGPPRRS